MPANGSSAIVCCGATRQVVESGRHEELMAIEGGTYRTLVGLQTLPGVKEGDKGEEEAEVLPILPHHFAHHVGGHDDHAHHDETPHVVTDAGSSQTKFDKAHQTRLWQLSRPEWKWVGVALCTAVVNGCTFPLYSLLLSSVVSVLLEVDSDYVKKQVDFWSIMFLVLASVVFLATFTQLYAFTGRRRLRGCVGEPPTTDMCGSVGLVLFSPLLFSSPPLLSLPVCLVNSHGGESDDPPP